jgi:hypothetical protein
VTAPAGRLALVPWLNPRVALGVLLIVTSVVVGARVYASADRYAQVLVAARPLVPGEHLQASDVTTRRVRFAAGPTDYLTGRTDPTGYVVTRYVGTGELLPVAALTSSASAAAAARLVTLPVVAGHIPPGLGRGDLVDVYVTPRAGAPPALVLAGAPVDLVGAGDSLGDGGGQSVVVVVPADKVPAAVRATESGKLDLVGVPAPAAAGRQG